jgi:phosphate/sulfate permease
VAGPGQHGVAHRRRGDVRQRGRATDEFALLSRLLVLVGVAASFVLGANDVSNAVGLWVAVHVGDVVVAGLVGGLAMGIGALTSALFFTKLLLISH